MPSSISGEQLRGHLETVVLALLSEGETHGFELLKRLAQKGDGVFALKEGTVYPVLYRLEQSGLVSARWEDAATPRRGPRRRLYRLTRKGERSLIAGREQWTRFVSVLGNIITPAVQFVQTMLHPAGQPLTGSLCHVA